MPSLYIQYVGMNQRSCMHTSPGTLGDRRHGDVSRESPEWRHYDENKMHLPSRMQPIIGSSDRDKVCQLSDDYARLESINDQFPLEVVIQDRLVVLVNFGRSGSTQLTGFRNTPTDYVQLFQTV